MSRRFTIQILLPVEGYEEDEIYESEEIALTVANLKEKPDDVYYRCLKEKSVYAFFHDVVKFAYEKYSLGEIDHFSVQTDHFGERKIIHGAIDTLSLQKKQNNLKENIFHNQYIVIGI